MLGSLCDASVHLGGWVICCCGPHGSGVAAVAQLSQCKASIRLKRQEDT